MSNTQKMTMKERVLREVERAGSMRYSSIQEFIVDYKYGAGTYANTRRDGLNPYRGYYTSALGSPWIWATPYEQKIKGGYFMLGKDRLVKRANGDYVVVRNNPLTLKNFSA